MFKSPQLKCLTSIDDNNPLFLHRFTYTCSISSETIFTNVSVSAHLILLQQSI
jgi:hypothetical protein